MIHFTVFYADVPGLPSRIDDYVPLMRAGAAALEATNPGARYVILTDTATEPRLTERLPGFQVFRSDAPVSAPLMLKYIMSQIDYLTMVILADWPDDIVVLASPDCIPNRSMGDALLPGHSFAITHRGAKFHYRINNVGYSRAHELAVRFLDRAAAILRDWPADQQAWLGDQESWEAALGGWQPSGGDDIHSARPWGAGEPPVWLYPCQTHNCIVRKSGVRSEAHETAFLLHFKGPRKEHVERYVAEHILKG